MAPARALRVPSPAPTLPSACFSRRLVRREARLPRSLARSALRRSRKASSEKLPSVPDGLLAQEEVAHGVGAELVEVGPRVHDVAQGLAHLVRVLHPPAVAEDVLGQGQARAHEEGRPVDGVEAQDVLADEVHLGGPEGLVLHRLVRAEPQGRDVVGEGVEPDVEDVLLVAREGDAPGDGGAGDGQVLEAALPRKPCTSFMRLSGRTKSGRSA